MSGKGTTREIGSLSSENKVLIGIIYTFLCYFHQKLIYMCVGASIIVVQSYTL